MPTQPRTRRLIAGAVATAVAFLGSLAGPLAPALAGEDVVVEMRLMHFTPEQVVAKTGSTVVFFNNDTFDYPGLGGAHRVVAENQAFDTGMVAPGARASRTFNEPMKTAFFCAVHPNVMQGTLTVEGPAVKPKVTERSVDIVEPKAEDPQTWGYDPADVTLDVGGKVTWRNNGATMHTVTADDGSFDEELQPGEKITISFPKAKAIRYSCKPHPWMKGSVKAGAATLKPDKDTNDRTSAPPIGTEPPTAPPAGAGPQTFNVAAVEPDAANPMGWGFAPPALTMRVKDTIVWKNDGAQPHTVTADDGTFDANLEPGATFRFTATETGSITYSCKPHPWMKGTVQILAAGIDPGSAPPPLPPPGEATEDQEPQPETHDEQTARIDRARVALAISTGAIITLLTAAILLAGALANRPRRNDPHAHPPRTIEIDLTDGAATEERELVGV